MPEDALVSCYAVYNEPLFPVNSSGNQQKQKNTNNAKFTAEMPF